MINIPIDDVWVLWPTTICSSFPEDPGNLYLNGKKHFKLELDFELTDETDHYKAIFNILPAYTMLKLLRDRMIFVASFDDGTKEDHNLPLFVTPHERVFLSYEFEPDQDIKLFIRNNTTGNEIDFKINMEGRNFKYEAEPFIVLAGDNIPERSDKEHFTGVTFHELKLYSNERLLSHHTFDEFIHDKSVDKTGNCNFIHKF